jgi:putative hydrolase of the HAD superfamily
MPDAIFLDLDDTLIRNSRTFADCWQMASEHHAPALDLPADALCTTIRQAHEWYWSDADRHREGRLDLRAARVLNISKALRSLGRNPDEPDIASTIPAIADAYMACRDRSLELFPDSLDALDRLCDANLPLALLTNGASSAQRAKIERFDLERRFAHIFIEGECGYGKPDKRIFHDALTALSVSPDACWMVGDNLEWEVRGAQAAGLTGVWFDPHNAGLPPGTDIRPDRIVPSLTELANAALEGA